MALLASLQDAVGKAGAYREASPSGRERIAGHTRNPRTEGGLLRVGEELSSARLFRLAGELG
jgi:hypothetical protein